ncbi:unnamed protein product [Hymenolepis diminuta]|uniref:Uncharacterized protein n=1 Tax=Hymenolepis diminuta TaxID=6216 RepID=A0A564YFA4_HYMDI|nr:unnamed protein product [Hymenolepis diminuta]
MLYFQRTQTSLLHLHAPRRLLQSTHQFTCAIIGRMAHGHQSHRNRKRVFWIPSCIFLASHSFGIKEIRKSNPVINKILVWKVPESPIRDSRWIHHR